MSDVIEAANALTPSSPQNATEAEYQRIYAEYAEASAYLRHYSGLRFAMLTVYVAIIGALAAVAFGAATITTHLAQAPRVAAAFAVFISAVFFTFELTCENYLEHFANRLRELEERINFRTMLDRPSDRSGVKLASRCLFGVNLCLWAAVAILGP